MMIDPRYRKPGAELCQVERGSLIDYNTDGTGHRGTYSIVWDPSHPREFEFVPSEQIFPAIVLEHCEGGMEGGLVRVVTKDGQPGYLNNKATVQLIQK